MTPDNIEIKGCDVAYGWNAPKRLELGEREIWQAADEYSWESEAVCECRAGERSKLL
jgi:hypothetical protein